MIFPCQDGVSASALIDLFIEEKIEAESRVISEYPNSNIKTTSPKIIITGTYCENNSLYFYIVSGFQFHKERVISSTEIKNHLVVCYANSDSHCNNLLDNIIKNDSIIDKYPHKYHNDSSFYKYHTHDPKIKIYKVLSTDKFILAK